MSALRGTSVVAVLTDTLQMVRRGRWRQPEHARRSGERKDDRPTMDGVSARVLIATARLALRLAAIVRRRGSRPTPRVAYLLAHAWGTGGTVRTTFTVGAALAADHDIEVLSVVRRRDEPTIPLPRGVRVRALDDQRADRRSTWLERRLRRRPSVLISSKDTLSRHCSLWTDLQIVRALSGLGGAVLVATRPSLITVVARLRPPRVVLIGQEHLNLETRRAVGKPPSLAACARLDALVTLTEEDRASYLTALPGLRVEAIPNAVPALQQVARPRREPIVLGVGRLTRQKGFDRLIAAFALVADDFPGWTLRITGEGRRRPELAGQIRALGLQDRVMLPGKVAGMEAEYARASVLAASSRFEGFPMVLLEAMSSGLPVVSMDCPTGPASLIEPGVTGLLTRRDDVEDLARGLRTLMADADLRSRMAAAARERLPAFSPDAVAQQWRRLFGELARRVEVTRAVRGAPRAGTALGP